MSSTGMHLTPIELIQASPLAMALYDNTGSAVAFSERWCALLPPYDDTQPNYSVVMEAGSEHVRRAWRGETCLSDAFEVIGADGQVRWVQVERGPWRGADGEIAYVLGHARDVTEGHEARRAAERSHERLALALRSDKMMVVETNLKTSAMTVLSESEELKAILNSSLDLEHVHPEDRPAMLQRITSATPEELAQVQYNEYRLAESPNTWISTVSRGYLDEDGALDHMVLVFQDITERVRARKEIERVAFTDALTGLPNRAKFQLEFERAVAEAETTGRPLGMIMVDVDHFKDINDTLGHDAGDALLKNLADHLRGAFREGDVIARLGGDEFAILLQDVATEDDLTRPLAIVRDALERPIEYNGQGVKISTSVGAALHNDADVDPQTVLKNADIALYKAKAQGRNCVVLFKAQMRTEVEQRLELLRDVRAAIPRGEFILFYQPVVSLSERGVTGFEALMRWNHPDHGVLTPSYFMAALDDPDLSLQLGDVTIETALKQMRAWLESGVEFGRLSINLASSQFRTGRLARQLEDRMKFWGVPPSRLTVEVTENVYLGWGAEVVSETVRALHDLGVTIALDDFGTGYASLANLRQFPIDRLKIDKSFVQNTEDDAIVRAVINLGASMGMEVVAEGVERPEQLAALAKHGCTQVQGFHLARPMQATEVQTYLTAFARGSGSQDAA